MSNTSWCINRRAVIRLMEEKGIDDITIAQFMLDTTDIPDRIKRMKKAAAEEGVPDYYD